MKRIIAWMLVLACFWGLPVIAHASGEETEIYTVEDLLAVADAPDGSYILMADLDMTGVDWKPLDFCGSFNGNGHSILNLTLSRPGDERDISYDGNLKEYDTTFVGFFGTLREAAVKDLRLLNVRTVTELDVPCFVGGLAGFSQESVITGCTVTGCLELRAYDRMFGVAGVVGYGTGTVEDCTVDVTLICTDTDPDTKDEQFLGGVFSTGFMDVLDCNITVDGYVSEFGYAHNGGITGMYMQEPLGVDRQGKLTGNTVSGKISFFECNDDRRAYCKAEAGEILARTYNISKNKTDFVRDERKKYDVELRPEMCAQPQYTQEVVPFTCEEIGHTRFTCTGCGYSYTDVYTLPGHTLSEYTLTLAPTLTEEGSSTAHCLECGLEFTRTEEKLPAPETQPTTAPATDEPVPNTEQPSPSWLLWLLPVAAVCVAAVWLLRRKKG